MITGNPVLNGRDPVSGASLRLASDGMVVSAAGVGAIGRYVPAEWRVDYDWTHLGLEDSMLRTATTEAEHWDQWAHREELAYAPDKDLSTRTLFSKTAALNRALESAPSLGDVSAKRILDIGGSCKDSVYFLSSGAARVDQVEVSAQSQRLALDRLRQALIPRGEEWEGRIFFHTIPAERLPFEDAVFDLVFSRSTVHHLARPEAFLEIQRVLKPDGLLFFIERYLGRLGHRALRAWRSVRRIDRGADLPLNQLELALLAQIFPNSEWHLYNVLEPLAYTLPPLRRRLRKLQDRADPSFLRGSLGTYCWAVARK